MRGYLYSILALSILIISASASSYSISSVQSLLSSYNVSSSTISSLQYTNITYSGMNYVALYNSGAIFMVVNLSSTQGYSIAINQTTIYNVIQTPVINQAIANFNLSTIRTSVRNYQETEMPGIIGCLQLVDINPSIECTDSYCPACISNPIIQDLQAQSYCGPGAFVDGIVSLENMTPTLNSTYVSFYSQLNTTNASDVSARVSSLTSLFGQATSITGSLEQLALFPPATNITESEIASCSNYVIIQNAPWYCQSTGFCGAIVTNTSARTAVNLQLSELNSEVSTSVITQQAQIAHNNAELFVEPVITAQKGSALRTALNVTLAGYSGVVNDTGILLTHISSPQLQASLSTLTGAYSTFISTYLTENITTAAAGVHTDMNDAAALYAKLNANYSSAVKLSENNTLLLLTDQLDSAVPSKEVASLSFQELGLNDKLSGSVQNISAVNAQLLSINTQAKAAGPGSGSIAFALTSAVDGPFVRALAPSLGLPYPEAVALAPLLSLILPLIISIVVLLIMAVYYMSLKRKHKVVLNSTTRKNWRMLFAIAIVIALVWMIATYTSASNTSSSTLSMFSGAVAQSSRIVVVQNGTSPGIASCTTQIQSAAKSLSKTVDIAYVNAGRCTVNGTLETTDVCMGSIAASGTPAIILQNGTTDDIQVYSYYGTYLKTSGTSNFIATCYPAKLIG